MVRLVCKPSLCNRYGSPRTGGGEADLGHHSHIMCPRCGAPGASPDPRLAPGASITQRVVTHGISHGAQVRGGWSTR